MDCAERSTASRSERQPQEEVAVPRWTPTSCILPHEGAGRYLDWEHEEDMEVDRFPGKADTPTHIEPTHCRATSSPSTVREKTLAEVAHRA